MANCTLLHKLLMLNISFGCCRHSVSNTSVQLTEGRSARDQPKQLPAKKNSQQFISADFLSRFSQQFISADFFRRSSQQIFSADLLIVLSFAVVRSGCAAIVLSSLSFAVVRGWWSAIVLSCWWSILVVYTA